MTVSRLCLFLRSLCFFFSLCLFPYYSLVAEVYAYAAEDADSRTDKDHDENNSERA